MSHDEGQESETPPPDGEPRSALEDLASELRRPPIALPESLIAQQASMAFAQLQRSILSQQAAVLKSFQPPVITPAVLGLDLSRVLRVPVPDFGAVVSRSLVNSLTLRPGLSGVLRSQVPDFRAIAGIPATAAFAAALAPKLPIFRLPEVALWKATTAWKTNFADLIAPTRLLLNNVFASWSDLATRGLGLVRKFAKAGLAAAMRARQAVLEGRLDEVATFLWEWLDIRPTDARCEAAAVVLLSDSWLPNAVDDVGFDVLGALRTGIRRETANHKWIGETTIRGQRVDSLDRRVIGASGQDSGSVGDLHADPATVGRPLAFDDEVTDGRLLRIVRRLNADQQRVVNARAQGAPTWAEAARDVGLPAEFGESVRRRCKRLATEDLRRSTQAQSVGAR